MKTLLLELILLLNTVRAEYTYSTDKVEAYRWMDAKYFYYTLQYANESFCTESETMQPEYCWWDTTVQSHCLSSRECLWLDNATLGGACYCGKAPTGTCTNCAGQTPTPTYSGFECPDDCKVYYVGCASVYCNCFGECADAEELGCSDPVDPHCHVWYTNYPSVVPTTGPSSPKSVYWGCNVCCFEESKIHRTTSSVAKALDIEDNKVKIRDYKMVDRGGRRIDDAAQQWEIVYEIGLEEDDSTQDMIDTLEEETVKNTILVNMNTDLELQDSLEFIETNNYGEDDPTAPLPSPSSSNSGSTIGAIIGALVGIVVLGFVGYRLYIWRNLSKYKVDTAKMTAEGLTPVGEDDESVL